MKSICELAASKRYYTFLKFFYAAPAPEKGLIKINTFLFSIFLNGWKSWSSIKQRINFWISSGEVWEIGLNVKSFNLREVFSSFFNWGRNGKIFKTTVPSFISTPRISFRSIYKNLLPYSKSKESDLHFKTVYCGSTIWLFRAERLYYLLMP